MHGRSGVFPSDKHYVRHLLFLLRIGVFAVIKYNTSGICRDAKMIPTFALMRDTKFSVFLGTICMIKQNISDICVDDAQKV